MTVVEKDGKLIFIDNVSRELEKGGLLTTVYKDGELLKFVDLYQIREKLWDLKYK
jgi:hypothetical protein